jgi:hypothetical protein
VKGPSGRCDEDIGAVSIKSLQGEALANALMKATTKAKRRATLSICGLSFVDESEIDSIQDARTVEVDRDGVILEGPGVVQSAKPVAKPTVDGGKLMASYFERVDKAQAGGELNLVAAGATKAHGDGVITDEQFERVKKAVSFKRGVLGTPPPPPSEPTDSERSDADESDGGDS